MFKIFSVSKGNNRREIFPENEIFIVYDLHEYEFQYEGKITSKYVFIEDEIIDPENITFNRDKNEIATRFAKRLFENYFGYLSIRINNDEFKFEVRIQKLKVPELEDILLYLWNQDPVIFNNFFSKSTLKSKLGIEKNSLDYSSKFVNIFEEFYHFFKKNFFRFKSLPHYVMRSEDILQEYDIADISESSIEWLMHNLDRLHFDYNLIHTEQSFQINNTYATVDKILSSQKILDFNVYENQIILGAFDYVFQEITAMRKLIKIKLSTNKTYEPEFYSINDFKIIPYLKLNEDLEKIENKLRALMVKYTLIFKDTKSLNARPQLTSSFSQKKHYSEAYNKIRLIRDVKINLNGELNLINIKEISALYERFNLFVIINSLLKKNPVSFSRLEPDSLTNIFHEYIFEFQFFKISMYYDTYVGNVKNKTGLQRISEGYYKPDYILKIQQESHETIFVLDSKYSSVSTVRNQHLLKCIKNYILDIGLSEQSNLKIEELILLYPGNSLEVLYGDEHFKPRVSIYPSKVNLVYLDEFISHLFQNSTAT